MVEVDRNRNFRLNVQGRHHQVFHLFVDVKNTHAASGNIRHPLMKRQVVFVQGYRL